MRGNSALPRSCGSENRVCGHQRRGSVKSRQLTHFDIRRPSCLSGGLSALRRGRGSIPANREWKEDGNRRPRAPSWLRRLSRRVAGGAARLGRGDVARAVARADRSRHPHDRRPARAARCRGDRDGHPGTRARRHASRRTPARAGRAAHGDSLGRRGLPSSPPPGRRPASCSSRRCRRGRCEARCSSSALGALRPRRDQGQSARCGSSWPFSTRALR